MKGSEIERVYCEEGMVAGESKRQGKQIGRSAGACMLWGGIWLRAKAKKGMVADESKRQESRSEGVLERVCCGVESGCGQGKGGNGWE